mmetsp:Transcript_54184/g.136879  ORF Transcript_54184/g.136879 Transcript_54184/m.136879 type:complete len:248 (-) Transcript_54184:455-1198(-)
MPAHTPPESSRTNSEGTSSARTVTSSQGSNTPEGSAKLCQGFRAAPTRPSSHPAHWALVPMYAQGVNPACLTHKVLASAPRRSHRRLDLALRAQADHALTVVGVGQLCGPSVVGQLKQVIQGLHQVFVWHGLHLPDHGVYVFDFFRCVFGCVGVVVDLDRKPHHQQGTSADSETDASENGGAGTGPKRVRASMNDVVDQAVPTHRYLTQCESGTSHQSGSTHDASDNLRIVRKPRLGTHHLHTEPTV